MKKLLTILLALILLLGAAGASAIIYSFTMIGLKAFSIAFLGTLVLTIAIVLWLATYHKSGINFPAVWIAALSCLPAAVSAIAFLISIWLILTTGGALGWVEFLMGFGFGCIAALGFYAGLSEPKRKSFRSTD